MTMHRISVGFDDEEYQSILKAADHFKRDLSVQIAWWTKVGQAIESLIPSPVESPEQYIKFLMKMLSENNTEIPKES